jgi:HAD superfamily hydrolase (TIGR01509 family)
MDYVNVKLVTTGNGMSSIEAVFFDCDGTLVDSEVICSRAYVHMFREFGITLELEEIFKRFKGVKLYEIIDTINAEYGVSLHKETLEPVYRAEVARLFDSELEVIDGANALLDKMAVPMCIVSNGPVSKMQHSLGNTGLLHHFPDKLFSGYDIQAWKPDPALMYHAAKAMNVDPVNCILVDDSSAGAMSGVAAGMEVFYFCADPHNQPIDHPKVTTFTSLDELPGLWKARGWEITQ